MPDQNTIPDGFNTPAKPSGPPAAKPLPASRIDSVDALRGLIILLMIFVNDLGPAAPAWMHHIKPPNADGMTLADIVFPAFLFLVGVSIPLAFERAQAVGKSKLTQLVHVLMRTAGLLLLGVIEMNSSHEHTLGRLWSGLAFSALILTWCAVPRERSRKRNLLLAAKALGVVGLLALLAIYRREPGPAEFPFGVRVEDWVWLRSGWWGILGLIGWAYLTVGLLVLLLGWRREWLMGALALLIGLHLAFNHGGLFTRVAGKPWLGSQAVELLAALARGIDAVGEFVSLRDALGSLAAISMAGCLLGTILRRDSDVMTNRARRVWALTFAAGLLLAGFVTDTFEGINKIAATPTWCLWSAGLSCLAWVVLEFLLNVPGFRVGLAPLRAAGANALVAYFLHPIVLGLVSLAGAWNTVLAYKQSGTPGVVILGSLAMAAFVCAAAGLMGRLGLRMRL